jgi:hypothetical protein
VHAYAHARRVAAGLAGKRGWLGEADHQLCCRRFPLRGMGVALAVPGPGWLEGRGLDPRKGEGPENLEWPEPGGGRWGVVVGTLE